MDLKQLWAQKWFRYGVPAAGALGLFALYQRKKTTGSTATQSTAAAQQRPAYAGMGSFDSTGTDIATWIGKYAEQTDDQIKQYQKNLNDTTTSLQNFMKPPGAPTNLRQTVQEPNVVVAELDPVAGAYQYVYRISRPDVPGSTSGAYFNTDPSFRFAGLIPGVQYQISAQSIGPGGISAPSIVQTWTGK